MKGRFVLNFGATGAGWDFSELRGAMTDNQAPVPATQLPRRRHFLEKCCVVGTAMGTVGLAALAPWPVIGPAHRGPAHRCIPAIPVEWQAWVEPEFREALSVLDAEYDVMRRAHTWPIGFERSLEHLRWRMSLAARQRYPLPTLTDLISLTRQYALLLRLLQLLDESVLIVPRQAEKCGYQTIAVQRAWYRHHGPRTGPKHDSGARSGHPSLT